MDNHRKGSVKPSSTQRSSHRPSNPKQVRSLPARDQPYGNMTSLSGAGFSGQREPIISHDDRSDRRQAYAPVAGSLSWGRTSEETHFDGSLDSDQGSGMSSQNRAAAFDADERRRAQDRQQDRTLRAQAMGGYVPVFPPGPVHRESHQVIERTHALHPDLVSAAVPQFSTNGGMWDEIARLEAEEHDRKTKKYPNRY